MPSGATAVIIVAVVCSLIASMEQPAKISLALAVTVLIAAVPVFGTLFYLLPFASDFPSMAAALAPLLVVCGFIIAEPGIGPFGTFAAVYFSVVSNIDNVMPYDSVGFLNNSVAILVGIGVALVLIATFFPETSAQAGRRFRRQLLVGLSRLAGARYPAIQAYEGALYEGLATILGRFKDEPNAARGCFAGAMIALSTARAIDGLRTAIGADRLRPAMAAGISSLLGHISGPTSIRTGRASSKARGRRAPCVAARSPWRELRATRRKPRRWPLSVRCEALRSNLLKALILLRETSDVR